MSTTALTTDHIRSAYDNPEWLGFGYLGERRYALADEIDVSAADTVVIDHANREGWSADDLFVWLNSKLGRWFAEDAFRGDDLRRSAIEGSSLLTLDGLS